MTEILSHLSEHSSEAMVIGTNVLLAHVTWRCLPEEARHTFRKIVAKIRRRPNPVRKTKGVHRIDL